MLFQPSFQHPVKSLGVHLAQDIQSLTMRGSPWVTTGRMGMIGAGGPMRRRMVASTNISSCDHIPCIMFHIKKKTFSANHWENIMYLPHSTTERIYGNLKSNQIVYLYLVVLNMQVCSGQNHAESQDLEPQFLGGPLGQHYCIASATSTSFEEWFLIYFWNVKMTMSNSMKVFVCHFPRNIL